MLTEGGGDAALGLSGAPSVQGIPAHRHHTATNERSRRGQ